MSFRFADWHWCSWQATLETEQPISDTRTVIIDTVTSINGSDINGTPVSEVHDVLNNIHDIVDKVPLNGSVTRLIF